MAREPRKASKTGRYGNVVITKENEIIVIDYERDGTTSAINIMITRATAEGLQTRGYRGFGRDLHGAVERRLPKEFFYAANNAAFRSIHGMDYALFPGSDQSSMTRRKVDFCLEVNVQSPIFGTSKRSVAI